VSDLSAPSHAEPAGAGLAAFGAAFRLLLANLVTTARVVGLSLLGVIAVILGVALRVNPGDDPAKAAADLIVNGYCLTLLVPVTALVFASATLGDLAEDGTLVYLWLKPVPRWQLVAAAFAATLCVALPVAVVPATFAAAIGGSSGSLTVGALLGAMLATIGYSSIFLGLGLLVRRTLAWGLAYILIWEGAVSRVARGAARLSVQVYARSLFAHVADRPPIRYETAAATAVIVVLLVSALALVLTVVALARDEVP
jgi:ABC-2 type transport system permease protein